MHFIDCETLHDLSTLRHSAPFVKKYCLFLNKHFENILTERWRGSLANWPAWSLDLTPLNFFTVRLHKIGSGISRRHERHNKASLCWNTCATVKWRPKKLLSANKFVSARKWMSFQTFIVNTYYKNC